MPGWISCCGGGGGGGGGIGIGRRCWLTIA